MSLFHEELDGLYGSGEVGVYVDMLFEAFLGWDKVRLLTSKEQTIDQSDLLRFHWALEDLKHYRPIQHIIGHSDFCGLRIRVTPDVLVPRPETEEIVVHLTDWLASQQTDRPAILDLCTGSGCIAIALKHRFPSAQVTAVDISPAALAIARDNAAANHTDIHFVEVDVLDPVQLAALSSSYDLIVSNPPYVMERERADMQPNVLNYDPALALFVPDSDPLRFYRAIGQYAATHLSPQGLLALEINQALSTETAQLLQALGFDPQLHHDFRGNPRCITASMLSCNTKE